VALITDSIKILVRKVMKSGTLCQTFIDRAFLLNVTFLMTPEGVAASGAACSEEPVFTSVYTPGGSSQPSSQPSSPPTSNPTEPPVQRKKKLATSGFVGFLTIVFLIWFLRFFPSMLGMMKKTEKVGHLYDILVVISDDEEAILENIRHEDITFFRRTNVEDPSQSLKWSMNSTSDVLEARFEVQFLDHYDLLGEGGPADEDAEGNVGHKLSGDKLVTKETYVHEAGLQLGMIIRVKPAYEAEGEGEVKSPLGHDSSGPDRENAMRSSQYNREDSVNSIDSSITEATRAKR
jgi:hypothetical protein